MRSYKRDKTQEEKKADRRIRLERKQTEKMKVFGRGQEGFTMIEAILAIALIGILTAIALPKFVDHLEAGTKAAAVATLEAGREAVRLDFAKQIMEGNYNDPFTKTKKEGQKLHPEDQDKLETMLQDGFNYYPGGFKWVLVKKGSITSAPILGAQLKGVVL